MDNPFTGLPLTFRGKDLLYFLRKQGWIVGLVFTLCTGTAVFYALGQPDQYVAQSKIVISPQFQVLPNQIVSYESYFITNLTFETEIQVLQSRIIAERIAQALAEPGEILEGETLDQRARTIQRSITVERIENTRLISIRGWGTEPEMAARIANAAAEQYIDFTAETRHEAYRKSYSFLEEQIAELEEKLQRSEKELIDYIRKADLTVTADPTLAASGGGEREGEGDVLNTLQAQLVSAELEKSRLQERYKEKHPKLVAVTREIEIIQKKIADEEARGESTRRRARAAAISEKERAIRYDMLKRDVEANKSLYDDLIARRKQTGITSEQNQPNVRIIERAEVPGAPFAPNRRRIAFVAGTGGLFLGILLALLVEWLNPRIRSIEEFKVHFALPVLASIPRINTGEDGKSAALISSREPQSIASEAFRTLRTNVKFSHSRESTNTLIITSCVPRDGKTTVSVNLATATALAGRRVVLVDADLRNPNTHKELGMTLEPGLAHLLTGEIDSYQEVARAGPVPNLSVITAGAIPPNPAELLEAATLQKLLARLSADFDQVIFDSPPVLPVTDASILASVGRNVLLVLDMNRLNRSMTQRSIDQLQAAGAHIYGVVLNYVDFAEQPYYYYSSYPYSQPETTT
ncbi:MAG: polysaccharide biosynthesis tyrosine autokinase [Bdellovibrionota bacterium]